MKRKQWILFVLLTIALAGAAVAAGGALNDPLISLEYLQDTFQPTLAGQIEAKADAHYKDLYDKSLETLEQETAAARARLQAENNASTGMGAEWHYQAALLPQKSAYGDTITLREGTGLFLMEGAAEAKATAGELIDLTSGTAAATMTMQAGHRYLAAEGASVTVKVLSEAAKLGLTGYYQSSASGQTALPFTDISRTSWYYEPIAYAYNQKLFSGMTEDQFWPSYPVTRAMLATVLYRMAGSPVSSGGNAFSDVAAGSWYEPGVSWSASVGVVKGMEVGAFWPNYNVTREQLAVMLHRYAAEHLGKDVSQRGDLSGFSDKGKVSDWAQDAMAWAVGAGILGGDDKGALNPGGAATRAEAATMMQRFAKLS